MRIALLLAVLGLASPSAGAATYWVSPAGADANEGSLSAPWASVFHASSRLGPGDELVIRDGTYHEALLISASGTPDAPVLVKAEHDGLAIFDGDGVRTSCWIRGGSGRRSHHIVVEGVRCQNSRTGAFLVSGSDWITLRRVSAYDASDAGNFHVFSVIESTQVLLEDTIAAGAGRDLYNIYRSRFVTLRRCFGRWTRFGSPNMGPHIVQIYGTSDSLVENCVGTKLPSADPPHLGGIFIWANVDQRANRNRVVGNVIHDLDSRDNQSADYAAYSKHSRAEGTRFENNVSIHNEYGLDWFGHMGLVVDRLTVVDAKREALRYLEMKWCGIEKDTDYESSATVSNSTFTRAPVGFRIMPRMRVGGGCTESPFAANPFFTGFSHSHNGFFGLSKSHAGTPLHPSEVFVDPKFDTRTYGKGAYLFAPDGSPRSEAGKGGTPQGAEVLYRYRDGVLTSQPLWPWPMEDRVRAELGVSVTWEAEGGLWKTLEGVYPATRMSSE